LQHDIDDAGPRKESLVRRKTGREEQHTLVEMKRITEVSRYAKQKNKESPQYQWDLQNKSRISTI
jgi:hypothetical protein